MCGIAGAVSLNGAPIADLRRKLRVMSDLLAHRGPDGDGMWVSERGDVGFVHRRLAIIDLSLDAAQPMHGENGAVITYNGEIYNYLELRKTLGHRWGFKSHSDTETILAAHAVRPDGFLSDLRGMFAFAIWDEKERQLLAARDRFGIKPFHYCVVNEVLYFASEAKALLPILDRIETDMGGLAEYFSLQYTLGSRTLFAGVHQLEPGHRLRVDSRGLHVNKYWDVTYEMDFDHSAQFFERRVRELLEESVELHLRSDVEVGAYVSGGIDSSLVALLANEHQSSSAQYFHGRFIDHPGYDESEFARDVTDRVGGVLNVRDMVSGDFSTNFFDVIYHLDYPVAGPGSFPQFMVSALAAEKVKVVLGGQGGDEIFGGYARYLIAYFEQSIKAAIDGTYRDGRFVVTIESIVPNLGVLREYTPLLREFWRDGLFGPLDERYFRLIDRGVDASEEIDWAQMDRGAVFSRFASIFNEPSLIAKPALFDRMTRFDFKALLPALLQVEDRMSMAHGLESRVPMLDHPLIEFAATIPADVKFEGGQMKHLLKKAFSHQLPASITARRDKMGFPVPLNEWLAGDLQSFGGDLLESMADNNRPGINPDAVRGTASSGARFSRKVWGLMSLEAWYQTFHDRSKYWKDLVDHSPLDDNEVKV
jgi:asparagine synthase (glutamine-hydrolysing)